MAAVSSTAGRLGRWLDLQAVHDFDKSDFVGMVGKEHLVQGG